jgi:hypothetical protein
MRRSSRIGVVGVVAVAAVAAASAYAAPAGSTRPRAASHVFDRTYSCRVRPQGYVDLDTSVGLTKNGTQEPAQSRVTTVQKAIVRNGIKYNVPQILFQAVKNSLKVDGRICTRSSRKVPLRPGLHLYETVTLNYFGEVDARCTTTKRVLVHLRIQMKSGAPQQALIAVRDDEAKPRKIAFFNWRPQRIAAYLGKSCIDLAGA